MSASEDAERLRAAVQLAFGILWHVKTDNRLVHEARHVLRDAIPQPERSEGIPAARTHLKQKGSRQ